AGIDAFHCSQRRFWEPEFDGSDLNLAGWVKKLTGMPTITVGSVSLDQDFIAQPAEGDGAASQPASIDRLLEMMDRGDFDLVAVGRALIANADWPKVVRSGDTSGLQAYSRDMLASLD
ncbi:MAG: 12-oxophytodienoate reductase, partial [Gammaproteobacteria bacterium]|nr:12-oxophytodienoate reductase [Gammaproteobacteria bacterium]